MIPAMTSTSLARYQTHLRAAGRAPGTIHLRCHHVGRMLTSVGKPPATITTADLEGWIAGHDWSACTHRSVVSSLRDYFGWLGTDAADGLQSPPEPRPCPKPTPPDVLDHALAHSSGKLHLLVRLAACTGLRRAELASVHSDQVERTRDGWWLRVVGKGRQERRVAIPADLAVQLLDCHGWAFPSPFGGHVQPDAVGKRLKRALGGKWTAHSLRHHFATEANRAGDLRSVQVLLGHASIATTQRYVQVDDQQLTHAAEAAWVA